VASLRTSIERLAPVLSATHSPASEGKTPSLEGATASLNSRPLTRANLRGKVVAVQIWTYSCVEWLRTFPYLIEWSNRYRASHPKGLVPPLPKDDARLLSVRHPDRCSPRDRTEVPDR